MQLLWCTLASATVVRRAAEVSGDGAVDTVAPPPYGQPYGQPYYPQQPGYPQPGYPHQPIVSAVDQMGLRDLQVGNVMNGEHLLPQLTPPPGTTYKFKNREKVGLTDIVWQDKNKYKLELDEIKRPGQHDQEIDADILKTETHTSLTGGHSTIHVHDKSGKDLFNIRRTRHNLNPVNIIGRHTYRIVCPGCKDNDHPWFTINRDRFFGFTQTWRVYRGRESDGVELYRCEGKWWKKMGAKMKVYRGGTDHEVGEIKQEMNAGFFIEGLPDKFTIEVESGEDAGLMMMLSIIIDSATDSTESNDNHHHHRHHHHRW